MKHVSILVYQNMNLAGMENARQGLQEANNYLVSQGKQPYFQIELVGLEHEVAIEGGVYKVKPEKKIDEVDTTNIILIPPSNFDIQKALESTYGFCEWINKQHEKGAEIVSLCLGAFILGSTGLLKNRNCVTHWRAMDKFKSVFPDVNIVSDKIITDECGIYTGGGAFSSANLILYLIEKLIDRETAIYCSKVFQIDFNRTSQSPFMIFEGQKDHSDDDVLEIQNFIERNYYENNTVLDLCDKFNMSRRTFERRFKKSTGNSLLEYLQRVRIEAAKKEFEKGNKTVLEVMLEVGYNDAKAFRTTFKKKTGLTPVDYRAKYTKQPY